jgi:hypothetical protein
MISPGFYEMLKLINYMYNDLQIKIKVPGIPIIVIYVFDILLFIGVFVVVLIDLESQKENKTNEKIDTPIQTEPQEDEEKINPDHYQIWNNWY